LSTKESARTLVITSSVDPEIAAAAAEYTAAVGTSTSGKIVFVGFTSDSSFIFANPTSMVSQEFAEGGLSEDRVCDGGVCGVGEDGE
jgi:hypothetical protein